MKKRLLMVLFLIVVATLLFTSCIHNDYEPIVEEPTFGTLVYIDDDGNTHEWTEDGDFTGMTPVIIP